MTIDRLARTALLCGLALSVAGCGGRGWFGGARTTSEPDYRQALDQDPAITREQQLERRVSRAPVTRELREETKGGSIWELFGNADNPNTTVEVNKYLWQASLEVLNFLPIESVDPFSGVIVTGFGAPPGGGRAYRATIYVQDPALDARSLKVALVSRGGAVPVETVRAVEDAILTRARQLRVRDGNL